MKDKLVRGVAKNGQVRVIGAITTNLVEEGTRDRECSPTAKAALGRMLTAGILMGADLKGENDKLTLKIDGGGTAKGVVVTAYSNGRVKGYIGNPTADLELNDKGKLNVSGIIGKEGMLLVIKDLGLKDPYVGQVPIYTGEVGDDLAYYYTVSEQTPSAVGVGVLVDTDLSIKSSGGFIIQMMPDADPLLADVIMYRLEEIPSITELINSGKTIEEILEFIFEGMDLNILEESEPTFKCDCSRERVKSALISIGKDELETLYDEGKSEELKCHFCNSSYIFTHEDIGSLLNEIKEKSNE